MYKVDVWVYIVLLLGLFKLLGILGSQGYKISMMFSLQRILLLLRISYLALVSWCDNWSCIWALYFKICRFYYKFYIFIIYILYVFVWCQRNFNAVDLFSILMHWWVIVLGIFRRLLRSMFITNKYLTRGLIC